MRAICAADSEAHAGPRAKASKGICTHAVLGRCARRFDADSDSQLTIEELRVLTTQVELFSFFAEDTASLFSLLDLDSNDFVGWQVWRLPDS